MQERLAAIRREQEQEAVRECSFRPAINGRSSRLMSDRSAVLKVELPLALGLEHFISCAVEGH